MAKFGEVAKKLPITNGSHDGLIASQNNGVWVFKGLIENKGVRHSLGSPGHEGYKLSSWKLQFISTKTSQRERSAAGERSDTPPPTREHQSPRGMRGESINPPSTHTHMHEHHQANTCTELKKSRFLISRFLNHDG